MLARALCYTLQGVDGQPVHVETDVSGGMQVFSIVGLPDTAVRESRDRVQSALRNSGYALPIGRITVNLSPADLKKEGAVFDLPIAVSIIGASRQAAMPELSKTLLLGELSLDGSLQPVRGALAMVIAALCRALSATLAGYMFWETALWPSLVYNGTYLIPDTIICMVLAVFIAKPVMKVLKAK